MKKILFLLLLTSAFAGAQTEQFELTPEGFVSANSPSNTYLVFEAPDKNQKELYSQVLSYLHGLYVNPDVALSTVEGEYITVNGNADDAIRRNSMHVFDINYTYTIRFKDGKMRIDAPGFKLTTYTDKPQELHLVWTGWSLGGDDLGIYGKKDKLKSKKAKEDLEQFFNSRVQSLVASLQNDNSDW